MAGFDNPYSRAVAVAKLLLPLVALGILSTLFLFSRNGQQGDPIVPSDISVMDLAREQRLGAPTYSGVTAAGVRVSVSAEALRPDPQEPKVIHGTEISASVRTPAGYAYQLSAATGRIDDDEGYTTLDGGVVIQTSDRYVISTDAARVATDMTRLEAPNEVEADGPMGHLTAGSMVLTGDPEGGTDALLVFKDGVRLLYRPNN
jgi:lipopolysaccharide export system protein LptC